MYSPNISSDKKQSLSDMILKKRKLPGSGLRRYSLAKHILFLCLLQMFAFGTGILSAEAGIELLFPQEIQVITQVEEYKGHSYLLCTAPLDWNGMQNYAEMLGGHLATIEDEAEDRFLGNLALMYNANAYFGLYQDIIDTNIWHWCTGEPVQYTAWAENEPNDPEHELYGMYFPPGYPNGRWNDGDGFYAEGYAPLSYLIEWDDNSCPAVLQLSYLQSFFLPVYYNGHTYQLISSYDSWPNMAVNLSKRGMHLATITTFEEDQFLRDLVINLGMPEVYFGLFQDLKDPKKWRWITGEDLSYQAWALGEPNNGTAEPYGVFFLPGYPDGSWNNQADKSDDEDVTACYLIEYDDEEGFGSYPPETENPNASEGKKK